jgi:O-antigen ligase
MAAISTPARALPAARLENGRERAVTVLQVYAVVMLVIPSDIVIQAMGGAAFPAGLIGMFAFAVWAVASLLGLHDPRPYRSPVRAVLGAFWLVSLISYALMNRSQLGVHELKGADRYLMDLTIMTGIAFCATEFLTSLDAVRRVLRAVCWGASFCGVVATLQFWLKLDITPYLRLLPGFSLTSDNAGITARDALNRVAGTAIHPIELAVVSSILLPLAIWLAIYDGDRPAWKRWAPVALIGASAMVSVSRSAILCIAITLAVMLIAMPGRQRLAAMAALPVALAGAFMSAHGLIRTLLHLIGVGSADSSIAHRVDNYPYVEHLVRKAPWLGQGVGTYIPDTPVHILDNQYLKTVIESGLVGIAALAALFLVPMVASLIARAHSRDPALRLLCAATAAGLLAAAVASATFDSFSFNMFFATLALDLGLAGAAWCLVREEVRMRAPMRRATYEDKSLVGANPARRIQSVQARGV